MGGDDGASVDLSKRRVEPVDLYRRFSENLMDYAEVGSIHNCSFLKLYQS